MFCPRRTGSDDGMSLSLAPSEVLKTSAKVRPYWIGEGGLLFSGDCMQFLPAIGASVIDAVFADPPFNLGKLYGEKTDDKLSEEKYLKWCKSWLRECVRVLKPGGSLFLYNLPRWNIQLGNFLMSMGLTFRNSILFEMKSCLPIEGRLYPAHYSLLYFAKGKPKTFRRIRAPNSYVPSLRWRDTRLRRASSRHESKRGELDGRVAGHPSSPAWREEVQVEEGTCERALNQGSRPCGRTQHRSWRDHPRPIRRFRHNVRGCTRQGAQVGWDGVGFCRRYCG